MNRTLVFGIAIFLAVVGIALLGGNKMAEAGHGCHGAACAGAACDGYVDCDGGCRGLFKNRCHGRKLCRGIDRCHGRKRCRGGLFSRRCKGACHGYQAPVCEPVCEPVCPPTCAGAHYEEAAPQGGPAPAPADDAPEAPAEAEGEPAPPAPPAEGTDAEPTSFRTISFVR